MLIGVYGSTSLQSRPLSWSTDMGMKVASGRVL